MILGSTLTVMYLFFFCLAWEVLCKTPTTHRVRFSLPKTPMRLIFWVCLKVRNMDPDATRKVERPLRLSEVENRNPKCY